ncbi:6-phosphogluconolactonase [Weissella cibaria]|uniref:6-phosphogluconolactonase n=1 Tax=Weissella cibaria TaxID=137591 RepID=UPI001190637A|nr:6-phosphogluconolactonase [Weissella cibaria]TVV34067.1 6-phosphogluconolactonase [Weissella cibaria]
MRIEIVDTKQDVTNETSHILLQKIYDPKVRNIALTAGTSPVASYEQCLEKFTERIHDPNMPKLHLWNFDEVPQEDSEEGMTTSTLRKYFLNPAEMPAYLYHRLDLSNWNTLDERLAQANGLDFMLLGIGSDGRYAGNLPGVTKFEDGTRYIPSEANDQVYAALVHSVGSEEKVPAGYVSMGPKTIMSAKEIVMIAFGKKKANIIKEAFFGPISEDVPASILQTHPNFTLLLDREAASEILPMPAATVTPANAVMS